ncbi:MAG: hypothetical protein Q7S21_03915 [archaeon]|nr:hypothetical protein [archaeon]
MKAFHKFLLLFVVLVVVGIFFVFQFSSVEAQKQEIKKVFLKQGIDSGKGNLELQLSSLNEAQLESLKKELELQENFLFFQKSNESVQLAGDSAVLVGMILLDKKISSLNEQINEQIFFDSCAVLPKIKTRNNFEAELILLAEKNLGQSDELEELKQTKQTHIDSYNKIKKECEFQ